MTMKTNNQSTECTDPQQTTGESSLDDAACSAPSACARWSVIIQTCDGNYITHNQDRTNEAIEGICAHNAWVSPNTPEQVIKILEFRVAPRMGLVAILPNVEPIHPHENQ